MLLSILLFMSPFMLGFVFVGTCVFFSVAGLLIFRKSSDTERLKSNQDAIFAYMNIVALLYAVLLAFLVIAVWESYDKNRDNVSKEADIMGSLIRNISLLPDSIKKDLHKDVEDYRNAVVGKEWETMQSGKGSPQVVEAINKIFKTIARNQEIQVSQNLIFNKIYADLNDMLECRRLRIIASEEDIPSVLWLTLIAGTLATIFFSYYFHIGHLKTHIVFTVVLGIVIGLTLFLVFVLEHPFQDPWRISSEVFSEIDNLKY